MSRLDTKGAEDTQKPMDGGVPMLTKEDNVNTSTHDYHEVAMPGADDDHPEEAQTISLKEMKTTQQNYFECQQ